MDDVDYNSKIDKRRNRINYHEDTKIHNTEEEDQNLGTNNILTELNNALDSIMTENSFSNAISLVKIQEYLQISNNKFINYIKIEHVHRLIQFLSNEDLCLNALYILSLIQSQSNQFTNFLAESEFLDIVSEYISHYNKKQIFILCSLFSNIIIDNNSFINNLNDKGILRFLIQESPFGGSEKRILISLIIIFENSDLELVKDILDTQNQLIASNCQEGESQQIKFPLFQAISKILDAKPANAQKVEIMMNFIQNHMNEIFISLFLSFENHEFHITSEIIQILIHSQKLVPSLFDDIDFSDFLNYFSKMIQSGNTNVSSLSMVFVSNIIRHDSSIISKSLTPKSISEIVKTNFLIRFKNGNFNMKNTIVIFISLFIPLITTSDIESLLFSNNSEEIIEEFIDFIPATENKVDVLHLFFVFLNSEKIQNLIFEICKKTDFFEYIDEIADTCDDSSLSELATKILEFQK